MTDNAPNDTLDLSEFDTISTADHGAILQLRNPAIPSQILLSNKKPLEITLLGRDSAKFRKMSRLATNRRLKTASRGRNAVVSAEENEADAMEIIIACTVAWSNIVVDGAVLECTPENVRQFYNRFPAFYEQADEFVGGRENFMKGTTKT